MSTLPYHDGICSKVLGSSGEFYTSVEGDHVTFFATEICQWMKLDYIKVDYFDGIQGRKFRVDKSFLDNGMIIFVLKNSRNNKNFYRDESTRK